VNSKGFTLIELMITVAIVGILAAVAVPSYRNYILESHRTDAQTALTDIQLRQTKLRANCRFYGLRSDTANACGATAAASTIAYPSTSPEGFYTMTITGNTTQGYVATAAATAASGQTDDTDCLSLTLTVTAANPEGVKGGTTANCW
jgi:type IV pilus assembly protein PilE